VLGQQKKQGGAHHSPHHIDRTTCTQNGSSPWIMCFSRRGSTDAFSCSSTHQFEHRSARCSPRTQVQVVSMWPLRAARQTPVYFLRREGSARVAMVSFRGNGSVDGGGSGDIARSRSRCSRERGGRERQPQKRRHSIEARVQNFRRRILRWGWSSSRRWRTTMKSTGIRTRRATGNMMLFKDLLAPYPYPYPALLGYNRRRV
jgi:hypothetical protein